MNFVSAAPKAPHKLALILSQEAKLLLAMDRYEPGVMAAQVAIRAFDRQASGSRHIAVADIEILQLLVADDYEN